MVRVRMDAYCMIARERGRGNRLWGGWGVPRLKSTKSVFNTRRKHTDLIGFDWWYASARVSIDVFSRELCLYK